MNVRCVVLLLITTFLLAGCRPAETPAPPQETAITLDPRYPTNAQPKLQTIKLFIGDQVMETELALRPHEVATGMMLRTNMAENEGMLFVFPGPDRRSFWMMNTLIPLSAAYINPQGVIEEIHKLEPQNTNPVVSASWNIQYVLETPQGWFERHNIPTGAVIRTERGALGETFTRQR